MTSCYEASEEMFESLFHPPKDKPIVAFFADKKNVKCATKAAVTKACADLNVEMREFDYRLESEVLQLLGVQRVPAVVLVQGGTGKVVVANSGPFTDIRLQLVAAGVRLP